MIYIVSGYMRSGTSMMMRALEAGGMTAAYSVDRDKRMNRKWGDPDYKPNDAYYELDKGDYRTSDFPTAYEGKLIKCLAGGMLKLRPLTQYRVVFMRRETKAIRESLTAFFGQPTELSQSVDFQEFLNTVISILRDRKSVLSVSEIDYDEIVERPLKIFDNLKSEGWPIDSVKAAEIPLRRHRRFAA